MGSGSPAEVAALVVAEAGRRAATAGGGRVVCVDGPAGSGKTTLAAEIARLAGGAALGPAGSPVTPVPPVPTVHMDDLMAGWAGGVHTGAALAGLVEPWAAGRVGRYRHYDWHAGRFDRQVAVPPGPWLIVEGVGSGRAALAALVTVLVWVEVDDDLRLARGLARDGAGLEPQWRRFMREEAALFAAERTRDRADVVVDGTGRRSPVVR